MSMFNLIQSLNRINKTTYISKDPKIIRRFEPFIWVAFIALTALVGCPVF